MWPASDRLSVGIKIFFEMQLIRDPPCNSHETCEVFFSWLYVAWVVLHRNRRIGASERRQLIPHVRFQVPFMGPETIKIRLRMCGPPLFQRTCNFLFDFAILPHFWYRQRQSQKWGRENAFLLFFTKLRMRSRFSQG